MNIPSVCYLTDCSVNTDFTLSFSITSSPGDYYDTSYWAYARIYQDSGTQTLKTDYANITFVPLIATLNQRSYRWQNDDGNNVTTTSNSAAVDTSLTMEKGEIST